MDNVKTSTATTDSPRVYPKRKRKQVSYFPSDTEESESEIKSEVEATSTPLAIKAAKVSNTAIAIPKRAITKPVPKKAVFPFNSLPPELKNKIYFTALASEYIALVSKLRQCRHVVGLGDTETFQSFRRWRRGRYGWYAPVPATTPIIRPSLVPNMLAVNRQMFAEAQPILYGANVFAFEDTKTLHTFCANIGPKNCAALRELSVKHWGQTAARRAMNYPAFCALASAVNLTRLSLDCDVSYGSASPRNKARQFHRDGFLWLEAVGRAKGHRDAAVDLIDLGIENVDEWKNINDWDGHGNGRKSDEAKLIELPKVVVDFRTELRMLLEA
ncbi:MAG: hypothetical protein Q9170_007560 [Blastenia crenularia]